MDWQAIWLSVRLATSTTAILLVLGLPAAYWLTYSERRWKFLVEALVALPLVLPPTVLGFYVLLAMGPLVGLSFIGCVPPDGLERRGTGWAFSPSP